MKKAIEVAPRGEAVSVPSPLLDTRELASYLRCSPAWVVKARGQGRGPPHVRTAYGIRYRVTDVDAWRAANEVVGAKMLSRSRVKAH